MSVAVALAPAFDKMILSLQNRFNIGKSKATGLKFGDTIPETDYC